MQLLGQCVRSVDGRTDLTGQTSCVQPRRPKPRRKLGVVAEVVHSVAHLVELRARGVEFTRGLSTEETRSIEREFGTPLPPELRAFLAVGVPVSERWARWVDGPSAVGADMRSSLARAFTFDIERNGYWHDRLGPRPAPDEAAIEVALATVHATPALLSIYAHRVLTTAPARGPRPVLSLWQPTDTIIYGNDLADYLHREVRITRPTWASSNIDDIPVWGDLLYLFDDPA